MLVPMFPIMMVIMMGKPDIDIAGGDAILHDGLHLHHIAALKWQFRELCAKIRLRPACRKAPSSMLPLMPEKQSR